MEKPGATPEAPPSYSLLLLPEAAGLEESPVVRMLTPQVLERATQVKGQVAVFVERDLWDVASGKELNDSIFDIARHWREMNRDGQTVAMIHLHPFTPGNKTDQENIDLYARLPLKVPVMKIARATGEPSDGWTLSLTNLGNRKLPIGAIPLLIVRGLAHPNQSIREDAGEYLDLQPTLEETFQQLSAGIFA